MCSSRISVEFKIYDFSCTSEDITALVGIIPTSTGKAGDLISPNRPLRHQNNFWCIKSPLEQSEELDVHIQEILKILQPGWSVLTELCNHYNAELSCYIYVEDEDMRVPAIHFNKETIQKVSELGAEIDIDMYLFPPN
jgi:hypothetical protein